MSAMEKKNPLFHTIVFALVLVGVLFLAAYFLPWQRVNWGKLSFLPASTVTVTGQAKKEESSQIARFTAGVTVNNDNKEEAISEVNEKVGEIIQAVKDFGISEEDIQTQNVSISKREDTFVIREEIGEWRASNSIEIVLRDVDKASDLADLLMSSGATNVSGPRFSWMIPRQLRLVFWSRQLTMPEKKQSLLPSLATEYWVRLSVFPKEQASLLGLLEPLNWLPVGLRLSREQKQWLRQ